MITGKCKVGCPKFSTYQDVRRERAKKTLKEVAKMKKEEFVKGDKVQVVGSGTIGEFLCYSEKKSKHKNGRKIAVAISGVYDLSMREKDIKKIPCTVIGIDTAKGKDETVIVQLPTPKTRFGWRFESSNLKLGYGDERPIVIGEALSVQEVPGTNTSRARTIEVGGFGLHAYSSSEALLKRNNVEDYVSYVELSGKIVEDNNKESNGYRMSAETRRCLGLVSWKPFFKQFTARLILSRLEKLLKRYPELNSFAEILEARAKGEEEKSETRSSLVKYLRSRIAENETRSSGYFHPKMMFPLMICGNRSEVLEMEEEMSKPPREYSVIVDMLMGRLDKAKEDVICKLMGAKAFAKSKRFAKKIQILEKALKDVSDLKLNEIPKFFCKIILNLFNNDRYHDRYEDVVKFLYAIENYDSFELHIKESLEQDSNMGNAGIKWESAYVEFCRALEEELIPLMKRSLETKQIIERM